MRVLSDMEVVMVNGGADICESPTIADSFEGIGQAITEEIGNFFAGLNQLGSDLGIWTYNYIHGC